MYIKGKLISPFGGIWSKKDVNGSKFARCRASVVMHIMKASVQFHKFRIKLDLQSKENFILLLGFPFSINENTPCLGLIITDHRCF